MSQPVSIFIVIGDYLAHVAKSSSAQFSHTLRL